MKEGLLGATLSVSSRSEREEARSRVARWFGSESTAARRPSARGLNLVLLMMVSFLPFPTKLIAQAIRSSDSERAAVVWAPSRIC
jgi:hypothetical protein